MCRGLGRRFVLIDENPVAVRVMRERLGTVDAQLALGAAES